MKPSVTVRERWRACGVTLFLILLWFVAWAIVMVEHAIDVAVGENDTTLKRAMGDTYGTLRTALKECVRIIFGKVR